MKTPIQLMKAVYNRLYYYWAPDKVYLNKKFREVFGRDINWDNPVTFNEKLQWLKVYNRNPLYTKLVDKYEVRQYISDKIGEEYLIPLLGVWNHFDEIDFDALPEQFVLKCTHDSASVVICRDKNKFDFDRTRDFLEQRLKRNFYYNLREWPYKNMKPRIIAEQYMTDEVEKELKDYKFYCFSGEPKLCYVSQGLENHETARISYVTLDWKQSPFKRSDFREFEGLPSKPKCLDEMIELSRILSKDTSFLRVDFYEINGKVYFGELTFYPGGGLTPLTPEEWDVKLGNMIDLRKVRK